MSQTPFVDYYRSNEISPVSQELGERHFERRESLYRSLGLLPRFVQGAKVLEFGPGSGHNALYTASLGPERYVLVDGNPVGLQRAQDLLRELGRSPERIAFVQSLFDTYETDERFDLVICEGALPGQVDPMATLAHMAKFVAPGGVLLFNTMDGASYLSEVVRRLIADHVAPRELSAHERLALVRPVFAPHLATIEGMSRPVDDWILDGMLQPILGQLLSIDQALVTLRKDFSFYNSSPRFFTDWRWYKRLVGPVGSFEDSLRNAYFSHLVSFIDIRVAPAAQPIDFGETLLNLCASVFDETALAENVTGDYNPPLAKIAAVANMVRPISELSASSLDEAVAFLRSGPPWRPLSNFASMFGQAQQYLTFIRR